MRRRRAHSVAKLTAHRNPFDEASVRHDAERLILDILEWYPTADGARRDVIRGLVASHRSFAWAAAFHFPCPPTDAATARQQLLLFSVLDQGSDSRDAILWLRGFCGQVQAAAVDASSLLREIAACSSGTDRYGFGSTQAMLVREAAAISAGC